MWSSFYYLWWFVCFLQRIRVCSIIHHSALIHAVVAFYNMKVLPFETTLDTWLLTVLTSDATRVPLINKRACIQNPAMTALDQHGHYKNGVWAAIRASKRRIHRWVLFVPCSARLQERILATGFQWKTISKAELGGVLLLSFFSRKQVTLDFGP